MTLEKNSIGIKKKNKSSKKTLPKNVFEIVGESGQIVERVDPQNATKVERHLEKNEPKQTLSERTKKRRVNIS